MDEALNEDISHGNERTINIKPTRIISGRSLAFFGDCHARERGGDWLYKFTPFNPPGWHRIATMAPLPFTIILSVGFGVAGLTRNSGRVWAIAGLVLTTLSVVAFIIMISAQG